MRKRKDSRGVVLKEGESERKTGGYQFRYNNNGKRGYIYAPTLKKLREKEKDIQKNLLLGIDYDKNRISLNEIF